MVSSAWRPLAVSGVILFFFLARDVSADTLYLTNGDRITGRIVGLRDAKLTIDTDYAGQLAVSLESIAALSTEDPRRVELKDGGAFLGMLLVRDSRTYVLENKQEHPIDLSSLTAIRLPGETAPADQASPEEKETAEEELWSGSVEVGATMRSGNTDTLDADLTVKIARTRPKHALTLEVGGAYGEVESDVNTRKARGELRLQVNPKDRGFAYGLTGAEHDAGRKLALRTTVAAGAGYEFIQGAARSLSGDIGLEYAHEKWNQFDLVGERERKESIREADMADLRAILTLLLTRPFSMVSFQQAFVTLNAIRDRAFRNDTRSDDVLSLRLSADYEQALFKESTLTERLVLRPTLDEFGEFRVTSELALTTPLSERLDIRLSWKAEYLSNPLTEDLERFDHTFRAALQYGF